jgi:hypothetical protein
MSVTQPSAIPPKPPSNPFLQATNGAAGQGHVPSVTRNTAREMLGFTAPPVVAVPSDTSSKVAAYFSGAKPDPKEFITGAFNFGTIKPTQEAPSDSRISAIASNDSDSHQGSAGGGSGGRGQHG